MQNCSALSVHSAGAATASRIPISERVTRRFCRRCVRSAPQAPLRSAAAAHVDAIIIPHSLRPAPEAAIQTPRSWLCLLCFRVCLGELGELPAAVSEWTANGDFSIDVSGWLVLFFFTKLYSGATRVYPPLVSEPPALAWLPTRPGSV